MSADPQPLPAATLKAELRALALSRRGALGEAQRVAASARATAEILPLLRPGETVSLFWPMRGEIDPRGLIAAVDHLDGHVVMPAIEDRRMVFRLFDGEACLQPGVFGTRHPHPAQPQREPDLVVAPLAAFDRRGGRIGYGGGFYDMYLAGRRAAGSPPRVVGIAFACQEVEAVPMEIHDEVIPAIATENGLVQTGPAG